ncbi:SCL-interrupting locus protein [Trichinella pseudospiralis]
MKNFKQTAIYRRMSFCPHPLVPEVSVCSPPKPATAKANEPRSSATVGKNLNLKNRENKPLQQTNNRCTSAMSRQPISGQRSAALKTSAPSELATLKSQVMKQDKDICEMKQMIQNLVSTLNSKTVDNETKVENSSTSPTIPAVLANGKLVMEKGCQTKSKCPHCNQPLELDSIKDVQKISSQNAEVLPVKAATKSTGNFSGKLTQPSSCSVSPSERNFVNEMILAARKWLKNDDCLDDIDDKSVIASEYVQRENPNNRRDIVARKQNIAEESIPQDLYSVGDPWSTSLSMEVNALAMHYLKQNEQYEPSTFNADQYLPTASGKLNSPSITVTRRQQVFTEAVSMNGILPAPTEMSLSSREFLQRHGIIPGATTTHQENQILDENIMPGSSRWASTARISNRRYTPTDTDCGDEQFIREPIPQRYQGKTVGRYGYNYDNWNGSNFRN